MNKFEKSGLTPVPGRHVAAPIVDECVAHIECRVEQSMDTGDKRLFVASVVDAYANEGLDEGSAAFVFGEFPEKMYGTRKFGQTIDNRDADDAESNNRES